MSTSPSPAPIAFNETKTAEALGLSVSWLRKDRQTHRILPFYKIGGTVRYSIDRCREVLAGMEEGGPRMRS